MNDTQLHQTLFGLLAPNELVLLMGPPGAGKDEQAQRLARETGAVYRSTGALLRAENDSTINKIMASGGLVPESELQRVLGSALSALKGNAVVLAGVTKKPREAAWLLDLIGRDADRRILVVIDLQVDEALARERIDDANRGRADDDPAVQEQRWFEYEAETLRSIEHYAAVGLVEQADANGTLDETYVNIVEVIMRRRLQVDQSW